MTEVVLGVHEINDDVIELNDDHWFFTSYIPSGKQLIIDKDDNLVLIDIINLLSDEDKIAINESKKQQLIEEANSQIILLQRAIKYNKETEQEKQLLEKLEIFTVDVSRIDTSNINTVFPDMPEQP